MLDYGLLFNIKLTNQYKTEPVLQQTSSSQLLIQITDADSLQAQWKNLLVLEDWR